MNRSIPIEKLFSNLGVQSTKGSGGPSGSSEGALLVCEIWGHMRLKSRLPKWPELKKLGNLMRASVAEQWVNKIVRIKEFKKGVEWLKVGRIN